MHTEPATQLEAVQPQKDDRLWAMIAHLCGFAGYLVPFGNIIGPLVIWQVKKDKSSYVAEHAKEALNFQISITLYVIVSVILSFFCIGFVLLAAIVLFEVVMIVIAAVKANSGERYRYPLTIRFIH